MSVLVTGGAGYIGSHMVWELLDHGEDVIVLDNLCTGFQWAVPDRAQLVIGNAGDIELVSDIIRDNKVDTIIHFAGSIEVAESIENPLKYYDNNTAQTRNLLEAAVRTGIEKFIFSSSAAVYGTPLTSGPIREDAILNPMSPYGSSKLMSEIMVRDTALAHDIRYVMLRYFNVAGSDLLKRTGQSTRGATHLIKTACEAATGKRKSMSVYGTDYDTPDGTCVRDFIHVSDLVSAHYSALNFLRNGGLKFTANCGYSQGYSISQVIAMVKEVSGVDFDVYEDRRRAGDIPSLIANSHRIQSRLGWKPRYNDLRTIIETALAWEAELPKRLKVA
ncbi:MAG: UDP-glucose 4-epimerase GalE [Nitratireductor sp.]